MDARIEDHEFAGRIAVLCLLLALAGRASVGTMRGRQTPAELPLIAVASDRDVTTWRADATAGTPASGMR